MNNEKNTYGDEKHKIISTIYNLNVFLQNI